MKNRKFKGYPPSQRATPQADKRFQELLTRYLRGERETLLTPLQQLLKIAPRHAHALHILGAIHFDLGDYESARVHALAALDVQPRFPEALNTLGITLQALGMDEQAETILRDALALNPKYGLGWFNLGNLYQKLLRDDDAMQAYRQGLEVEPTLALLHHNLGRLHQDRHQYDEALACYQKALQYDPEAQPTLVNLGVIYRDLHLFEESEKVLRQVIALNPDNVEPYNTLGWTLHDMGRHEDAAATFAEANRRNPNNLKAHSNYLFLLTYHMQLSPPELLAKHREWESQHAPSAAERKALPPSRNPLHGQRPLRIGYVSPDFRKHVVRNFIQPVIENHDPARVEVFLYAQLESPDAITHQFEHSVGPDHFRYTASLDAFSLARLIRQDNIDILIDLAGHSGGNRLDAFAYKPAPIQAAYLGYIATTGLSTIDWRITDGILNPPDTQELLAEKLYRLPRCYKTYRPAPDEPDTVLRQPSPGAITFGSLHRLSKLTDTTIALWSRVLQALPQSQLLLARHELAYPKNREAALALFARHGVAASQILLRYDNLHRHMAVYNDIDIALDPTPVTGGATTAEALWMGVPVLTLAGHVMRERISASILHGIGMPEWIASSTDLYVEKAVSFAHNPSLLSALRANQRARFIQSQLGDERGLAAALEDAYQDMWQRHVQTHRMTLL